MSDLATRLSVGVATRRAVEASVSIPAIPYRGLESFRVVDSPIFFARDREVRKLLRYITMYRAVLLYGDSGSGKSSLINAGLIPAIMKEGFIADRIRVQPRENEEFIVERMSRDSNGSSSFLPSNFTGDEFKSAARIVVGTSELKRKLEAQNSGKTPLLIFDQFEELVTLFEESPPNREIGKTLKIQERILDTLVELISNHKLQARLLFVFREDYLAKLTKFFVRCPDLVDHYQRLTPPPKGVVHSLIRGPFEKFPGHFGVELSSELADSLSQQIIKDTDSVGLNLSEVQIICLKLWTSNDPAVLLAKRGIQGLLEDFLSEALNTLPSDLRAPALALLRKMVTSSGTRNVISEDDLIHLVQKEEKFSTDLLVNALEALVSQTKLVRRERRLDVITYQLVSEFLIPWIKQQQQVQHARLVRRRAIRWISLSLLLVLIMAAASLYVWKFRTEQALRDAKVRDLTDRLLVSENARSKADDDNLRLFSAIQSNNKDAVVAELTAKVTSLTKDVQAAKNDSSQLKAQIDALQTVQTALRQTNDSLNTQVQTLNTENQSLRTTISNYERLQKDSESRKAEINALTGQVNRLTQERDTLARENYALKALAPGTGGSAVTGSRSGSDIVFQYDALGEGHKIQLKGEEFRGLLTLELGNVLKNDKPIYIYKTEDDDVKITNQRVQPSKTNFRIYFEWEGKLYQLEGRIAGEVNSTLRNIKIVRLW